MENADLWCVMMYEQNSTPSALPSDERNFPHLHFEFLQPDRIRDAQKRSPDDLQYDPKTLYVPDGFLCKQTPVCVLLCFFMCGLDMLADLSIDYSNDPAVVTLKDGQHGRVMQELNSVCCGI